MFDYLSGVVTFVAENKIVIDCNGIGFAVTATTAAINEFHMSSKAKIPVYLAVKEDALDLYGFSSVRERELFLRLISVSGVGAKLAITLLSGMSVDRLASSIANADTVSLSAIKGVGKKTAERIALELRDKIAAENSIVMPTGASSASMDEMAVLALASLGYDKKEAEAAVRIAAKPGMTTEQIVYSVLHG